ncbi:MAG: mycofactocin-associated electron transfer flavoprotein beta subunit [Acidimicrobiales bacterium]|nr:mycofactocin-associated electron transfer flavoprotein beta subunit [Acidimicrobiales bacterium]
MAGRPVVGVCLKWVDLRPDVDRLTGAVHRDERFHGASEADQAALEWALRMAEAWDGEVVAVSAGPPAAEALLRDCLATGVHRAVRVDLAPGAPSETVASVLADVLRDAAVVCCGDWSLDRGSGAVPAFLAGELGAAQALGLVRLEVGQPGSLVVTRRLDFGRRERLGVRTPAVLSVEGASATLRRASLAAVLAARDAVVEVAGGRPAAQHRLRPVHVRPYRPRPQARPGPDPALDPRLRLLQLTGAAVERTPPRTVVTDDADEAAELLLEQLRAWGYLT